MGGDDFNKTNDDESLLNALNLGKKHFHSTPDRLEKEADKKLDKLISEVLRESEFSLKIEAAASRGKTEIHVLPWMCHREDYPNVSFRNSTSGLGDSICLTKEFSAKFCDAGNIELMSILIDLNDESSSLSVLRTFGCFLIALNEKYLQPASIEILPGDFFQPDLKFKFDLSAPVTFTKRSNRLPRTRSPPPAPMPPGMSPVPEMPTLPPMPPMEALPAPLPNPYRFNSLILRWD